MKKWRYKDEERPRGVCYDCGLSYEQFPVELVIAHDQWKTINPTEHQGGGLLCHDCMILRLKRVGITQPNILFFGINDWTCSHHWKYAQKIDHVDHNAMTTKEIRWCLKCNVEQDLSYEDYDLEYKSDDG